MSYFDKFGQSNGIPFMEGATKADLKNYLNTPVHIIDFGFIQGEKDDYACIQLAEAPGFFFFANAIITSMLHEVDADNQREALKSQAIIFNMHVSKKTGRDYMGYRFSTDTESAPF